jgi:AcrR family transcriptional regulator
MKRTDSSDAPRARLLAAGKSLFAEHGYEQTSTAAIARRAGTSESQLIRYFHGKTGLLAAIFDAGWAPLNVHIADGVRDVNDAGVALSVVLSHVIDAFDRDSELAHLFIFEGRRIREVGGDLKLTRGYLDFVRLLHRLIRQAQTSGIITSRIDASALAAALLGAAEGMIRDRLVAARAGRRPPYSQRQIHLVFSVLLKGTGAANASSRRKRTSAKLRRAET